jgi:hypothetical protein
VTTMQAKTREVRPSITCPDCGTVSDIEDDVRTGWCRKCGDHTGAVRELVMHTEFDRGRPSHFDRQAHPITLARWAFLSGLQEPDYKRVAEDTIGGVWISTVWVGLDMNFMGGRPLIFETMAFDKDGDVVDFQGRDTWRYGTEAEAISGHEAVAAEARVLREGP